MWWLKIKEEKYLREIQTRERLMQIIIIVSGFFLAYSEKTERDLLVFPFILFIVFAILYYVSLTRSKNNWLTDMYGFFSAYGFSLLILLFINLKLTNPISGIDFLLLFFAFTGLLSFGFLSPNTNTKIDNFIKKSETHIIKKYPKLSKGLVILFAILMLIYIIYKTIISYT